MGLHIHVLSAKKLFCPINCQLFCHINMLASTVPAFLGISFCILVCHDTSLRLADIGIRSIMMIGEHLSDELKESTNAQFNCSILEHYGSGECGRMASSCPHCGQFHAHAETVFLEVVDGDGTPTAAGNVGRILATPLYNYAMPLIRYDHLDDAQIGSAAGCPITLPTLKAIYGKKRIPFIFPGGITIRPMLPVAEVVKFLGAQAYQVAQIADDTCEFRIVAGKKLPSEMRFEEMTKLIRSLWWSGLQVNYRIVDQLPRKSPQGKVAMFIREMSQL